jgi:hypothetical protein
MVFTFHKVVGIINTFSSTKTTALSTHSVGGIIEAV